MNCEKVAQLENSYLLGELEEAEMKLVKNHLNICMHCRQRLASYEEVLGRMFEAITPVTPSGLIKRAVLTQAEALRPAPKLLRPKSLLRLSYGAIAATFVLLALVAWQFILLGQVQNLQTQTSQLLEFSTSPDTVIWLMSPPDLPGKNDGPAAKMFAQPNSDFYYLTATRLPSAPANQVYRFWYVEDNQTKFGGVLQPNATGDATLKVSDPDRSAIHIKSCFVTLEAANSSTTQPVSPPLLKWEKPTNSKS